MTSTATLPLLPGPEAIEAELAKRSLVEFVRLAWPIVEPETELRWNWHLDVLCEVLESAARGDTRRVIFNVPPGCGKSLLVSVFFPAWLWAQNPGLRFLCASYGAHLSIRDNLRVRDIVTSEWYQRHYGVELHDAQRSKIRFDTTASGWRVGTSVGGVGTGEHPDYVIIDDPSSAEQARSEAERESANRWFDRTVSTRGIVRDVRVVVIMQRLHSDDLTGHLLARGGWDHLCLPMRYEPEGDLRDIREEPGDLLWPELFPEDKVRQLEIDLGAFGSAGQLQQRPAPEGGGLFRRDWLPVVDALPAGCRKMRSWDTASTEGGGDWTVGVLLAESEGEIYVADVVREQLGPGGVDRLIGATATRDGRDVPIREEQEGGSAGKAVIQARSKMLAGYDYAGVPVSGDKVTRAQPFRAQCEAGNVRLLRGAWNGEYIDELCSFPAGAHDDQVDSTSCGYNALVLTERKGGSVPFNWKKRFR